MAGVRIAGKWEKPNPRPEVLLSSPLSLLDILAEVPDPRHRRGIRHPLSAILGLAVLAMLSGC
ncbi:MAG: transposase family protein, partial [Gemmataceae bacterium]